MEGRVRRGGAAAILAAALLHCAAPGRAAQGALAPAPATPPANAEATPTSVAAGGPEASPGEIARQAFADALPLEAAGNLRAASASFERAYLLDRQLVHAGMNAALLRERLGDDPGARLLYARILDEHPGFAPAVRNVVRLALRAHDGAAAEKEARTWLERGPQSAGLHNALGDVLLAAGRLDESEQESRKALKLDERNVAALVNLATVYQRRKRDELARMVLENARAIDDRDPTVWNRLGLLELAAGNRPQALEDFRTAAALGPDCPDARTNYGELLAEAEDFAGAVSELEAAVRYAPWSAAAWLDLGSAYRGAREFEKAESAFRKAGELDPSAAPDVEFNLAVLYLDGEKPGMTALARLEQAVAFLDGYQRRGGDERRATEVRSDAARAIEREKKRLAREERDRLRREAGTTTANSSTTTTTTTTTSTSTSTTTATPEKGDR